MPFSAPSSFSINVLQSDIDSATPGSQTNSLVKAMERLSSNKQLPGQASDTFYQQGCAFFAQISPILIGLTPYLATVLVCTDTYGADNASSLIIAAENLGVKPSEPYLVNLVKA